MDIKLSQFLCSNHYTIVTWLNLVRQIEKKEYILENIASRLKQKLD